MVELIARTELSQADARALARAKEKRTRHRPAKVPARLARTSAFAAKRRGLITDSAFERMYYVKGHSLIRVSGRELGTQHRDALIGVFRMPCVSVSVGGHAMMMVRTTWREILIALGLTQHKNNVAWLVYTFEDLKKVVMTVFEGKEEDLERMWRSGRLPDTRTGMGNLLNDIKWSGVGLDDELQIFYGDWTAQVVKSSKLVSLDAEVHFALQTDYAKAFWPYIDGLTQHTWVGEEMLAQLVGRDLWGPGEDSATRAAFRKLCRKAFEDMKRAGGLINYRVEVQGKGWKKRHVYHHVHALRASGHQLELPMAVAG